MQVSNPIHYSSDPYLISKKQYDVEHKKDARIDEPKIDISTENLAEKTYAKSINAPQSPQAVEPHERSSTTANTNTSVEKALAAYNAVENSTSSRPPSSLDQVKQMV